MHSNHRSSAERLITSEYDKLSRVDSVGADSQPWNQVTQIPGDQTAGSQLQPGTMIYKSMNQSNTKQVPKKIPSFPQQEAYRDVKVRPNISKQEIENPVDTVCIKMIPKVSSKIRKPERLLVLLFEGVISTMFQDQNKGNGADFYEDDDDEDDTVSEEQPQTPSR